jgi:hypothetical protein
VSLAEINRALDYLEEGRELVMQIAQETVREELLVGIDCAQAGFNRARGFALDSFQAQQLLSRYREAWLKRARPGGLEESLRGLNLG